MNADRLRPALVVVLGVLAISAAAASMDGPPQTETVGSGSGDGSGAGDANSGERRATTAETDGFDVWNWLQPVLATLFGGGALVYLFFAVREMWANGIDGVRQVVVHAITTIVPAGLAYLILFSAQVRQWVQSPGSRSSTAAPAAVSEGGGSAAPDAVDTASQTPTVLLLVGALVALVIVAVILFRLLDGDETDRSVGTANSVDADEQDVQRSTAVDTPTAVADADATNDVYRVWRDFASAVDGVDLRTHTPTEIADRASERGFDQQAVRTITDLFEEVRYGQHPPTSERESRARSALDRVRSGRDRR